MGLGVTSLGGETMLVEVGLMPGGGKLSLTGKLGDVMQESAKAAYSWVRSNAESLRIDHKLFKSEIYIFTCRKELLPKMVRLPGCR